MKVLTEETRSVLQALGDINKIAVIDYPMMNVKSESGSVIAFFSTEAMKEEEFESFGIFNTQELLQVVSLADEPEINLDNSIISINGTNSSVKYITTDLGILGDYTKVKPIVLQKTKEVETVVKFDLTSEDLTKIKKASDVFKNLEDFIINSNNSEVNLEIGESNKKIKNSNSYSLKLPAESNKDINITINVKNLKMIPIGDYTVQVKYKADSDAYRLLLTSNTVESLEFIIATSM